MNIFPKTVTLSYINIAVSIKIEKGIGNWSRLPYLLCWLGKDSSFDRIPLTGSYN